MRAQRREPQGERLQKVLAHAGIASRRQCEEYIVAGRVAVNGRVVTVLGTRVDPTRDRIAFDRKPVQVGAERRYYLLYKPVGFVTTVEDTHGRPVVVELVPGEERLFPVGRLDLDSEGLLLMTNDGELTHRLLHPRFEHEKEYLVLVRGRLSAEDVGRMAEGLRLEGEAQPLRGQATLLPERWGWRGEAAPAGQQWVRIVLTEGRKRQIRRMIESLGQSVERLIRVRMATLQLGKLDPGEGRWLSEAEVRDLRALGTTPGAGTPRNERDGHESRAQRTEGPSHRGSHRRAGGLGQEHRRRPRR